MKKLLAMARVHFQAGEDLVLVTIIASSGATPRGVGARMLVSKAGRLCGTIGGGAVEYRSEQIAQRVLEEKSSREADFSLTRKDVQKLGMICGGDVRVFFSYIPAGDQEAAFILTRASELMGGAQALWLVCDIAQGGRLGLYTAEDGFMGLTLPASMEKHLTGQPRRIQEDGFDLYIEEISSPGRVIVFGGGHVAQELVPVLSHVGFRCVVMDDREEFTKEKLFPGAEAVILGSFGEISRYITVTEQDYVCVMTRGHAFDTAIQAQVLPCRPQYVGVIGSRTKAAGVRRVLKEEYGLPDGLLDMVTTPIGLSIGAKTPEEIAVSIAAQMIAVRAGANKKE